MAKEIERKFLVKGDTWRKDASGVYYRQGYLLKNNKISVRVRVTDKHGYLTIKTWVSGITRLEYEYPIPLVDAEELLDKLCEKPIIEKTRYSVQYRGMVWEVDEFQGENKGLMLAEVEIKDENQTIDLPSWVGREVSDSAKFYNANLVKYPFNTWSNEEQKKAILTPYET